MNDDKFTTQNLKVEKLTREDMQKADPEVAMAVIEQLLNLQKDFTQNVEKIFKTYRAECALLVVTVINAVGMTEPVPGSDKLIVQSALMGNGKNLVELSTSVTRKVLETVHNG